MPGQLADFLEVADGVVRQPALEQAARVVGVVANRGQRLVQLVADAGRHLPESGHLGRLDQLGLGFAQGLLGLAPLLDLGPELAGSLLHPVLELVGGDLQDQPALPVVEVQGDQCREQQEGESRHRRAQALVGVGLPGR